MKHLIINLSLLLIALLMPTTIFALDFEVDGIYYNITGNNEVSVTQGYWTGAYSDNVIIPQQVSYYGRNYSVTAIEGYAFYGCSQLTDIVIPNSVNSIGDGAFYYCTSLTSINIPNSVTSMGYNPFSGCSGLMNMTVDNSNPVYDSRDNCNAIIKTATNTLISGCGCTIIPNTLTSIDRNAFLDCTSLTDITIPNSVTAIGSDAFYGCTSLTSVTIGNSVTTIGSSAFSGCRVLTSLTFGNSVTTIDKFAFDDCFSLTSITLPKSVTSIDKSAFFGCSSLANIAIESGCTTYDSRDNCNAIIETSSNTLITGCKNTIIPNSVTIIGEKAFYYCAGLTNVIIPNSVITIGKQAFYDCSAMTSLTIGNSVTTIDEEAFEGCKGLTSIEIPNSVTFIGFETFAYCRNLQSLTIGNSVTSIGGRAFGWCSGLQDVYSLVENPSQISIDTHDYSIFHNNYDGDYSGRTLHVPVGTIEAYQANINWYPYFGNIVEMVENMGDANGDGMIDVNDITSLIDVILENEVDSFNHEAADMNGDGILDIEDIIALINIVLGII